MTMVTDTSNMNLEEILHYSEVGLLDIEGADLIAQAFREGENKGYDQGVKDEEYAWITTQGGY